MKVLATYDGSGPKYHRILLACHGLEQHDYQVQIVRHVEEKDLADTDILLFNRLIAGSNVKQLIEWREKYGFKMVCDMDDHYILGKDHPLYEGYQVHKVSERIVSFIQASDLITVTHERLQAEIIKAFPRHEDTVHVLPNCIPRVQQFLVEKIPSELTRLFWAGGITHRKDLELLRNDLKKIKRDKVKLVMCGYEHNDPEWKAMAKIFTTDSAYNTQVFESLPVHEYYRAYAHCDISLIPLVDNEFNKCKSNLKILEAANIGAPCIVSRVHPYLDFPDHLVNYVDSHRPWYYQIKKLLSDEGLQRAQGFGLQEYVNRHYNFEKITLERKQIFDHYGNRPTTNKIIQDVKQTATATANS